MASSRASTSGAPLRRWQSSISSATMASVSLTWSGMRWKRRRASAATSSADLTRCGCIDSTVVKMLLYGRTRVDAFGGRFALVIPVEAGRVARVAELMGFKELFSFPTLEGALATVEHVTRVGDARARVGDEECFVAQCACGWRGQLRAGEQGWRAATNDAHDHSGNRPARARSY